MTQAGDRPVVPREPLGREPEGVLQQTLRRPEVMAETAHLLSCTRSSGSSPVSSLRYPVSARTVWLNIGSISP